LYNLTQYESKSGATEILGDLEKHEEDLCEEERWRSLHNDDVDEKIKEEEEHKRAKNTAQFQFNYDETSSEPSATAFGPENTTNPEDVDDGEPYEPTEDLCLPSDIPPPPTVKLFNVIEKTALLIAGQGPQMEILLKAKQSGNPVFEFLSIDHPLHRFYKHLLTMVKTKQYKKKETPPPVSLVPQYSDMAHMAPDLAPKIISIPYKRSEDCSYSQLITKLQKYAPNPAPPPPPTIPPKPPTPELASTPPPQPPAALLPGPIVIPPTDLQTIIDKMASYVARNGRSFEEVVRSKDKNRFSFLGADDKHHNYYLHKLAIYTTGNYDPSVTAEPLTFKLKKPDSGKESSLGPNNAISGLDYGSDSEDNQDDKKDKEIEDKADKSDKESDIKKSGFPSLVGFLPPAIAAQPKLYQEEEEDKEKKKMEEETKKRQEETNKLRDKLAAKAREKMVLAAKEKALQLERKRKAANFLAQLAEKKTSVSSVTAVDTLGDSSAEEGELVASPAHNHETVTAVSIWPPPAPPKLVIPKLAGQAESPVELSSDSEEERRRRKKRRKSRSRSRTRDRKHDRARHKTKRSRSKHKKSKKHKTEKRRRLSGSDKDNKAQRRRYRSLSSDRDVREKRSRKYNSEDSESDRKRSKSRTKDKVGTKENTPVTAAFLGGVSREETPEISVIKERHNPIIEGIVQPKVNKMTEELRAKVRAMLESKK